MDAKPTTTGSGNSGPATTDGRAAEPSSDGSSGVATSAGGRFGPILLPLLTALVGVIVGQGMDLLKTRSLRLEDARIKARELAWTQASDAFQRLFGLNMRLRSDIARYRAAEIEHSYHGALARLTHDQQEAQLTQHFQLLIDDYTNRVIDDRTQLQGLLGWVQFMLPTNDKTISNATHELQNLSPWYPPLPPSSIEQLPSWRNTAINAAMTDSRAEINDKFAHLLDELYRRRDTILAAAAHNYVKLVDN